MAQPESPRQNGGTPRQNGDTLRQNRGTPQQDGGSPRTNGVSPRNFSSRRRYHDAQKSQKDLELAFEEMYIHDVDLQRKYTEMRRLHKEQADLRESAQAKADDAALEKARQERETRRRQAEEVFKRHILEEAAKRKQKEEEERLRQQRADAERAELLRKTQEEKERIQREAEEKARAEAKRKEIERQRARQAEVERERQEQERLRRKREQLQQEAAAKKAEAEATQQAADAAANIKRKAEQEAQAAAAAETASPEKIHEEYLELYFSIKKFKNEFWENLMAEAKKPNMKHIKEHFSQARREIKAEVGKYSFADKAINTMATGKVRKILEKVLEQPVSVIGTRLPVNNFLPCSLRLDDDNRTTITDQAAYMLCILAKSVCKTLMEYATGSPERAEPLGTMLSQIFSLAQLQFNRPGTTQTQSLFPIVLAKYHRTCPALFGITADQTTSAGKQKLGWRLMENGDQPKTTFASEALHYDRMKGLAFGYASFGLRNFSSVTNARNPYPPTNFWRSIAQILNLPPDQVQPTHVCLLRNIFGHGGIDRFLLFFGAVGVAMIREAYVEFPQRLPDTMQQNDHFVKELKMHVASLGDKDHFHLT